MPGQISIDFNVTHQFENNRESQQKLDIRREDFNLQCWQVLMRMLAGERITMKSGLDTGIGDIRRRAKDLIDGFKIQVKREWAVVDGEKQKYKWYYIDDADKQSIINRIINKTKIN